MKIQNIVVAGVLGISYIDVAFARPCALFAGHNGAGKTSIATAVRMALTREIERSSIKREQKSLVKDGAKAGTITVVTDQGTAVLELPSGDPSGDWAPLRLDVIRAVCDSQRFIAMDAAARRKFLFSLAGIKLDPAAITERLHQKGCDKELVTEIASILAAGFDAAAKRAGSNASEARGAWKQITGGETYGDKKAATWEASAPPFTEEDAAEAHKLEKTLAKFDADLADAQKRLGAATAAIESAQGYEGKVEAARTAAHTFSAHDKLWRAAEKDVATWQAKHDALDNTAGSVKTLECPGCMADLVLVNGVLEVVEKKAVKAPDPAEREEITEALRLSIKVRDRHKTNRDAAERAKVEFDMLEKNPPKAPEHSPESIQTTIDTLNTSAKDFRARIAELQAKSKAFDAAAANTKAARAHHEKVQAWSKIADALSPDGIPAEILAEGLKPINRRLAESSMKTDWPQVTISPDMEITWDGRPYRLVVGTGGSEEFRAQAMIAEAVSFLSGFKFLMLDNCDHCLPEHRVALINWLDGLAQAGEIETALLFMATKARPKGLPDTFAVHWIEGGKEVDEKAPA